MNFIVANKRPLIICLQLPFSQKVRIGVVHSKLPSVVTVPKNEKIVLFFYFVIRTDIQIDKRIGNEAPWEAALREFNEYSALNEHQLPFEDSVLMKEHVNEWKGLWESGGIEIENNIQLARVVNSSIFWILSSVRDDWPFSLSPGSLATNAYNGLFASRFPFISLPSN